MRRSSARGRGDTSSFPLVLIPPELVNFPQRFRGACWCEGDFSPGMATRGLQPSAGTILRVGDDPPQRDAALTMNTRGVVRLREYGCHRSDEYGRSAT